MKMLLRKWLLKLVRLIDSTGTRPTFQQTMKAKGCSLEFSDTVVKHLTELRERTGDGDIGVILQRSIATYDMLSTLVIIDGGKIIYEDKQGFQKEIFLFEEADNNEF